MAAIKLWAAPIPDIALEIKLIAMAGPGEQDSRNEIRILLEPINRTPMYMLLWRPRQNISFGTQIALTIEASGKVLKINPINHCGMPCRIAIAV